MKSRKQVRTERVKIFFATLIYSIGFQALPAADQGAEALATANTAFGFNLMKQVVRERSEANVFISPYSISAALQMLWQGAGGEAKKEMDRALALSGFKTAAAGSAYKELDKSIKSAGANT